MSQYLTKACEYDTILSRTLTRGDILKIKEKRESIKLTQEELANMLNVKRSTVSMWETGEAMPRADKLPELAKILECSIDDLYMKK